MRGMGKLFCLAAFCLVPGWLGAVEPVSREPVRPFPYAEEEVSYPNPKDTEVVLRGTLTRPQKDTPVPAVLLISGAGPQDRDETIAGHKPFLVLSDYLTRRGLAVLRVDDRGTKESSGNFEAATTRDFASDAEAGVHFLMARSDIDHKHIGLIGHGEGAIIATMLAAQDPQIAFLVLLAGTAVPGENVLLAQTARAEMASGLPDIQVEADERIGAGLYGMVRRGASESQLQIALDGAPEQYAPFVPAWRQQIPRLESAWLRFFLSYDPKPDLEKIQCPLLALFGEKDMQVDPEQNSSAMKSAFSKGHNHGAKVKVLPGLNYLFQKANTGLAREYPLIPETMSPVALEAIGDFIAKQT